MELIETRAEWVVYTMFNTFLRLRPEITNINFGQRIFTLLGEIQVIDYLPANS